MYTKISKFDLSKLSNSEYLQMMVKFREFIERFGADALGIGPLFQPFSVFLTQALAALESEKSSGLSPAIIAGDLLRDNDYRVLYYVVKGYTFSSKPEKKEAADQLMRIFKDDDNPLTAGMSSETTLLNNIVTQLRKEPYAGYLARLYATEPFETMAESNAAFVGLSKSRTDEQSVKPSGDVKAVRTKIDPLYRNMVGMINSTAEHGGSKSFGEFIALAETDAKQYHTIIAQRTTRNENKKKGE